MTCTVVSVMPYMLTTAGCGSPWRSNHGTQALEIERLAAEDDVAQRERCAWAAADIGLDQLAEGGGRLVEHGDFFAASSS